MGSGGSGPHLCSFWPTHRGSSAQEDDSPGITNDPEITEEGLVLDINELNSIFKSENFDIKVFKVEEKYDSEKKTGKEELIPLYFAQKKAPKTIDKYDLTSNINTDLVESEVIDMMHVEHYFDINIDEEIDNALMCELRPEWKTKGIFSDRYEICKDSNEKIIHNIYDDLDEDSADIC